MSPPGEVLWQEKKNAASEVIAAGAAAASHEPQSWKQFMSLWSRRLAVFFGVEGLFRATAQQQDNACRCHCHDQPHLIPSHDNSRTDLQDSETHDVVGIRSSLRERVSARLEAVLRRIWPGRAAAVQLQESDSTSTSRERNRQRPESNGWIFTNGAGVVDVGNHHQSESVAPRPSSTHHRHSWTLSDRNCNDEIEHQVSEDDRTEMEWDGMQLDVVTYSETSYPKAIRQESALEPRNDLRSEPEPGDEHYLLEPEPQQPANYHYHSDTDVVEQPERFAGQKYNHSVDNDDDDGDSGGGGGD